MSRKEREGVGREKEQGAERSREQEGVWNGKEWGGVRSREQ